MKRAREDGSPSQGSKAGDSSPVKSNDQEGEASAGGVETRSDGGPDDKSIASQKASSSPDSFPSKTAKIPKTDNTDDTDDEATNNNSNNSSSSSTRAADVPAATPVAVVAGPAAPPAIAAGPAAPAAVLAGPVAPAAVMGPAAPATVTKVEADGGGATGGGGSAGVAAGAGAGAGSTDDAPLAGVEGVPNETLFVGNLSYKVSEAVIIKLFTPFGKVVREQFCYHMVGPRRGEPRGFCFVEYSNVEDAAKAIRALHGRKLYGRPLRVRFMTVEGKGRMDYSTATAGKPANLGSYGEDGAANIPPAEGAGSSAGVGAGVTKLSLDKKVALLKLKLREARKSGT